jgi:ATP-binding cassette subfamily F protein uup
MDKIVDSLFVFNSGGNIENFPGNYSDYRIYEDSIPKAESKSKTEKAPKETKQKEESKLSYSEKKEYNNLENLIEKLEKKKQKLEAQFASGEIEGEEINQASIKLQKIIDEIEEKELRWLELSEKT